MIVIISLGGSVITPPTLDKIRDVTAAIGEVAKENRVLVVVGGGDIAREYIDLARVFGADEVSCDLIGIGATRLNAMLLISTLSEAFPEPPCTYEDAKEAISSGKIVVMGGVSPGYTTDAVGAILAEYIRADLFVSATSVDGIYDLDPKLRPDAKRYECITPRELVKIVMETDMKAGSTSVIDPVAAKIIERCGITTIVVQGKDPNNIIRAVRGEYVGTKISPTCDRSEG
jgi:uridylate kinase